MPSRLERILRILLLLQTRVPYDAIRLAHEMQVHRRTIFRDIAALRGLGIPVDFDNESACYSLASNNELDLNSVSIEELTELLVSACLAANLNSENAEATKRVALKLSARLPEPVQREIAKLALQSEVHSPQPAFHTVTTITSAIRKNTPLLLSELAPSGKCLSKRLVPESLTYCSHGWVLMGTDETGVRRSYIVDGFPLAKPLDLLESNEDAFRAVARSAGWPNACDNSAREENRLRSDSAAADPPSN